MQPPAGQGTKAKLVISQADNYAGNFGEVLRSSAIFWVKNSKNIRSTISFSNYWKYKNSNDVNVVVNLRDLKGNLIRRLGASFEESEVFNYSPPDDFEGSVEVEAFSIKNMRIPYAAVMAVYESPDSVSMVHSYSRAYSQHEIEEKRTICIGEESCWTLRESHDTTSFAAIHNGATPQASQTALLGVRNAKGREQTVTVDIPGLAAFETLIIEPRKLFGNIIDWLEGEPGNGRFSFNLNGGFTRMLCGIKKIDESQLQVTHSNFNYSAHQTDTISDGIARAYMRTPNVPSRFNQEIVVYPDNDRGEYVFRAESVEATFVTGEIFRKTFDSSRGRLVEFDRTDNILPTRIVTGLRLNSDGVSLPSECSLGVVHHNRPRKHFSWMLVSARFNTQICWVDFKEVYGGCPDDAQFVFMLYTSKRKDPLTRKLTFSELKDGNLIGIADIFSEPASLGDEFGYLTIWCSYGGFVFFSTLQKKNSICIEHSF